MRAAGVWSVGAAVDAMVLIYSLAFPADSKFLSRGLVSRRYGPLGFSFS